MSDTVRRWYKGFLTGGKVDPLIQRISRAVDGYALRKYIPVVRFERKARGQFYYFVAIEGSSVGEIPAEVSSFFELPFLGHPLRDPLQLEDIRGMVSGEVEVQDYALRIPYRVPHVFLSSSPFDPEDVELSVETVAAEEVLVQSQAHERLLLWLSAVGSGSWTTFQAACRALGLERGSEQDSRRIMRKLRLLGHAETSRDGSHWSVAPTTLVELTDESSVRGRTSYVLCGARDASTVRILESIVPVEMVPQIRGSGPPAVLLHPPDVDALLARLVGTGLGPSISFVPEASLHLAGALPSVDGWVDMLETLPGLLPQLYDCRCFDGEGFVETPFNGKSGFYELWPPPTSATSAAPRPAYRAFYDAGSGRWVRGDWYGLRFLAHVSAGHACPAEFDPASARLAVSAHCRWPELYERALVLASGRLPTQSADRTWLIYERISSALLEVLVPKLKLTVDISMGKAARA